MYKDIPVVSKERPASGMGSASPRYELHTACCDIFISADDSLDVVRRNAVTHGIADLSKLVIYDLGARR